MKALNFRAKNSLKIAVACIIATIIFNSMDVPLGFFSVVTIFILMNLFYEETLVKGVERVVGAASATALSIIFVDWFYELPIFYYISMALSLFVAFYLFASKRYPYASLIAGITIGLIMITGIQQPEEITSLGIGWVVGNTLGLVITWLFDQLWPLVSESSFEEDLSESLLLLHTEGVFYRNLQSQITIYKQRWQQARPFPENAYLQLIFLIKQLALETENLENLPLPNIKIPFKNECLSNVKQASRELSLVVQGKSGSRNLTEQLRVAAETLKEDDNIPHEYEALYQLIQKIANVIEMIFQTIETINGRSDLISIELPKHLKLTAVDSAKKKFHWNKLAVKHSIKITLSVMLLTTMATYFGWPAGIQAVIAVVVMTAQPNLGRAHLRFHLRFLGVFVGGVLGLIGLFLLSKYPSFTVLLVFVFIAMLVSSFIALGSEKISYFGIQMGVMIPIVLLFTNGPTTDMLLPIQRFVGVVEGGIIAAIVLYFLWPEHPLVQLRKQIESSIDQMRQYFSLLSQQNIDGLRPQVLNVEASNQGLLNDAKFLLFGDTRDAQKYSAVLNLLHQWISQAYYLSDNIAELSPEQQKLLIRLSNFWIYKIQQCLLYQVQCLNNHFQPPLPIIEEKMKRSFKHIWHYINSGNVSKDLHLTISSIETSLYQIAKITDQMTVFLSDSSASK